MEISAVDICNRALTEYLGVRPIMSLDERTDAGKACKQHYEAARRDALAGDLWRFASTYKDGVASSLQPKAPWSYVFAYPPDAIRVFEIQRATSEDPIIPFEVTARPDGSDGKLIHCNVESPVFIYTIDRPNPVSFDAEFVAAMAALLAVKMAMPLTKSIKVKQAAQADYARLRSIAVTRASSEGSNGADPYGFHHTARGE